VFSTAMPTPVAADRGGPFVTVPLGLKSVLHKRFRSGGDRIDGPDMVRYFTDLTAGHDVGYLPERVARARGNSFISLTRELLAGHLSDAEPIDLAIVAHDTPDFDPRLSAPVTLTAVLPGGPLVFAVSGHGSLAGFLALRVAAGYARRQGFRRVVILVVEQRGMPYETPRPAADAAVGLLLEAGAGTARVALLPDVVPAAAKAEVDRLAPGPGIRGGGGLSADFPAGISATGLWAELAECPVFPAGLADYDPIRRNLGVCLFDREFER
jgi:hypothetical protein